MTVRSTASIQQIVGIETEYGPATTEAVKAYQRLIGAYPDGDWGPMTEKHFNEYFAATVNDAAAMTVKAGARSLESILDIIGLDAWTWDAYDRVCKLQTEIGAYVDGVWGRGTESRYARHLAKKIAQTRGIRTTPLTLVEVARTAKDAGFSGEGLVNSVSVAIAESGRVSTAGWVCDPIARLVNVGPPRSVDRGLWQINDYWHPEVIDWKADIPALAAKEAFRISSKGNNWTAWSTWNNGTAAKRRSLAVDAIAALG